MALLSPLAYHTVDANHSGAYRRVTVLFDVVSIPAPLRERLAAAGKEIYLVPFPEAEELRAACLSSDREFFAPLAESILVRMLYDAVRIGGAAEVAKIDPSLEKILSYIDAHLCEPISLDAIASAAMLSKSSLCHLFAERMKISPKQYILKKRLALARARIGEGMMPTEAALSVGYFLYSPIKGFVVDGNWVSGDTAQGAVAGIMDFVATLVVFGVVRRLVAKFVSFLIPQPMNAIAGALIGLLKSFVIVGVLAGVGVLQTGRFSEGFFAARSTFVKMAGGVADSYMQGAGN